MSSPQELVDAGSRALSEGEWRLAHDAFSEALASEPSAEAMAGLGEALWWLGNVSEALDRQEAAYAAFRRRGEAAGAAEMALALALDYETSFANTAAAAGWLERARRLVEEGDLEALRGRVHLLDAHFGDPAGAEVAAHRALEVARSRSDADLELCALSQLGAALVDQGRVSEGLRRLDESMAGSLGGEGSDLGTVAYACCTTLESCVSCAQFGRAVQWVRAADRFTRRYGCPYLYVQCRTHYGALLLALGDWEQAEEELTAAVRGSRDALPAVAAQALSGLAELRTAQGRVEEAERLLHGFEDHACAASAIARIQLARGRPTSVVATLGRWIHELGEERLECAPLVELLGEAEVAVGDHDSAKRHAAALDRLGSAHDCEIAVARGERLSGRVQLGRDDAEGARGSLEGALAAFASLEMPLEVARTRLLLAEALRPAQPEAAIDEARTALSTLGALGARPDADAAAELLRSLGAPSARGTLRSAEPLTGREHEILTLLAEGLSNPQIAERLYISRRTVETHVARVLAKLGLESRAQVAAEVARRPELVDAGRGREAI